MTESKRQDILIQRLVLGLQLYKAATENDFPTLLKTDTSLKETLSAFSEFAKHLVENTLTRKMAKEWTIFPNKVALLDDLTQENLHASLEKVFKAITTETAQNTLFAKKHFAILATLQKLDTEFKKNLPEREKSIQPSEKDTLSQSEKENQKQDNTPKPSLESTLYFSYNKDKRENFKALTTFTATLSGERTSTTRFLKWPGSDRYGTLKAGECIRFFEDKDKSGRYVDVIVDSVKKINMKDFSENDMDTWSSVEGWSVQQGNTYRSYGDAFQIRYHVHSSEYERLGIENPRKEQKKETEHTDHSLIPKLQDYFKQNPVKIHGKDIPSFKIPGFECFSNTYPCSVEWGDSITPKRVYLCTELPYMMAKTKDPVIRKSLVETFDSTYKETVKTKSHEDAVSIAAKTIKKMAKGLEFQKNAQENWDTVKLQVMENLVKDKFYRNPNLAQSLLQTGTGHIQEGNYWKDTFWGVSLKDHPENGIKAGDGQNHLGKILMNMRASLQKDLGLNESHKETSSKKNTSRDSER